MLISVEDLHYKRLKYAHRAHEFFHWRARQALGSRFQWICDTMDNDLKHALGDMPNSEFIVDPQGQVARKRAWSRPEQLRKDLEQLVGPVDSPTQVADLDIKRPKVERDTGGMRSPALSFLAACGR